jgi:hypothetical protein
MKWWFNSVAVSVCVLLAAGGCHGGKKAQTAESKSTQATTASAPATAAAGAPESESMDAAAVPSPVAAPPTPTIAPVAAPQTPKPAGEQPMIKFENTLVDFGDIKPDSKNDANYTFTNVGKVNLKIVDIQKTCGCTVFELTKREYAPGESGTIKVEYSASKQAGPVIKHLFVMTNDPNNPRVELMVKATIVVPVEIEPMSMQLTLDMPEANIPSVTIYSKDNKPFSIKSVESNNNVITAQIDPNATATRFVVKLNVDMEKLGNNLNGFVRFNITHPDLDTLTVSYTTIPEFEVQPASLILRSAIPLQPERREVWVKNNYNKSFDIESISSSKGYIKVTKKEKIDSMYKLLIEITPPELQKTMFFSDTLTINIKNAKPIEIVCRGFFRRTQAGKK